ncbi:MAG: transcriptional regulator [Gemmatimonadaceae bacterium]
MRLRRLDAVIHAPNRLQICALLMPLEEAEFQMLRETAGISDSVLSKQIKQLEDAGYVEMRKGAANGRPRTWIRLTGRGRRAFAAHVAALQDIASLANG